MVRGPRSRRIADKIAYARLVAKSMRSSEYFPNPIPALDDLDAHIVAAEAAQVAALTREIGKPAALKAALRALRGDLERLELIVQHAANLHPTDGPAVITTSGMNEKDNRGPGRADFAVRLGRVSGNAPASLAHSTCVASNNDYVPRRPSEAAAFGRSPQRN
jgi:hypothetical protein